VELIGTAGGIWHFRIYGILPSALTSAVKFIQITDTPDIIGTIGWCVLAVKRDILSLTDPLY